MSQSDPAKQQPAAANASHHAGQTNQGRRRSAHPSRRAGGAWPICDKGAASVVAANRRDNPRKLNQPLGAGRAGLNVAAR